jgi:glycosyltransferase involved in cell wall biosynthesis
MEALSLGVPVLASRVGALPELIDHGTNGWLCEPGDIDDFVGYIEQFAQRPDRAALRELTRAHAVQHLDQRVMLARYRRALEGSLQGE